MRQRELDAPPGAGIYGSLIEGGIEPRDLDACGAEPLHSTPIRNRVCLRK
jgi:hypothetical protein